jgi:hypothetical protein
VVVAPLLPKVECRIGADSPVSTSLYWFDKLDHRLLLGRDNVVSERALSPLPGTASPKKKPRSRVCVSEVAPRI